MKSKTLPFVVGLFVLASFALIIGFTLFLGASRYIKPTVFAEMVVTESVSGLTIGSPVKFRGVQVGEVKAIDFLATEQEQGFFTAPVLITMELNRSTFRVDSQADFEREVTSGVARGLRSRLTIAGLTGGLVVEMSVFDPTEFPEPPLPEGFTPKYALVPAAPALLKEFIERFTTISDRLSKVPFDEIGNRLNTLLANGDKMMTDRIGPAVEEAQASLKELRAILADKRIEGIIGNIDSVTAALADTMGGESPANLKTFIAELPKIAARVREVADHVDAVVANEKIPQVIDALAKGVGPTLDSLRRTVDRVDALVASEQFDIRELVGSLRTLVSNLDSLATVLKGDPARIIFSRPPTPIEPRPIPAR